MADYDMKKEGWIAVDFDGTLAEYKSGTHERYTFGNVIVVMRDRILKWINEGFTVKIFTARLSGLHPFVEDGVRIELQNWCERNGLPRLEVTNVKDHQMLILFDDRAIQVEANTGKIIGYSTRPEITW